MNKERKALDDFIKDYLGLCEKLCTNKQEKMLLDSNSPYNILKQYFEKEDKVDNKVNPSEALKKNNIMRRYCIFQLPLSNLKKFNIFDNVDKVDLNDYVPVYTGEDNIENDYVLCEKLFNIFNRNHPSGFAGHSMSVSDIIEITDNGKDSWFYYCDDIGFVFLNEEKEKFINPKK